MRRISLLFSLGLVASLGTAGWLLVQNGRLKREIAEADLLRVPAKPLRPVPSKAGAPASTSEQPLTQGSSARPGAAGSPGVNAAEGTKPPLRITENADGTFTVSDSSASWERVMSAAELREFNSSAESTMQAAMTKLPGGPSWSPGRAAGPPDTTNHGDYSTAWASQSPDGGKEWLQVKYPKSVEISEINIHETYNSGAVSKVSAIMPDGKERVIWEGTMNAEEGVVERAVKVPPGVRSDQIRIELDTSRVPGWNEIDAVELVGRDGRRQWGQESTASSYFGQGRGASMVFGGGLEFDGLLVR